jgi:nitrogen fixation protein
MVSIPEEEKDEGVLLDGERWEAALREMPDWSDVPVAEECC